MSNARNHYWYWCCTLCKEQWGGKRMKQKMGRNRSPFPRKSTIYIGKQTTSEIIKKPGWIGPRKGSFSPQILKLDFHIEIWVSAFLQKIRGCKNPIASFSQGDHLLGSAKGCPADGVGIPCFATVPTTPCCLTLHHCNCLGPVAYEFVIRNWDIENVKLEDSFVNWSIGHLYSTMSSFEKRSSVKQFHKLSWVLHSGVLGWLLDEFIHLWQLDKEA